MPVGTPSAGPLRFVGRTLRHLATPGAGIPDAAPPDSPLTPAAGIGQGGSMSAPYGAPAEPLVANVVARHARPLEGGPHDFAPLVAQAAGVRWILLGEALREITHRRGELAVGTAELFEQQRGEHRVRLGDADGVLQALVVTEHGCPILSKRSHRRHGCATRGPYQSAPACDPAGKDRADAACAYN